MIPDVYSQSGTKWATGGNGVGTGDFIGTTNAYPLLFKTNNAQKMQLSTSGVLQLNNLSGTGNRLLQTDASGNIISFNMGTSSQVLYGNGTWGALPLIPTSLWQQSGSNLFFNTGNVGIGTATPLFPLDVIGDARISNNLYVGGGIIITDKVNANTEVVTSKVQADSIVTDSTKGFYGTSKFNGDVKLQNKLDVTGNTVINGTATVNGDFKTMGSLTFGGDKTISYTPASPGRSPIYSIGSDPHRPPGPCWNPPNTSSLFDFTGLFQSFGYNLNGGQFNTMFMGFDGTNGIVDVQGASSGIPPHLLLNYNCGHDVEICTGTLGGNISIGAGQGGNVNILSGTTGNLTMGSGTNTGTVTIASGAGSGSVSIASGILSKVGIGTTLPSAKFEIQNNDPTVVTACISKVESPTQTRKIIFEPKLNLGDYNALTQANDAGIFWSDGNGGAGTNNNAGFVIGPWPNTTGVPFKGIRITSEGYVGIGTDLAINPNHYKLAVDGTIGAKELKIEVTSATWPDYVFEKNYKRMSLLEKEAFYLKEKHLPNIDSKNEIEKNGLQISTVLTGITQNVEENTIDIVDLYKKVIDLQKENEKLKKQIENLENK